MKCCYLFVLGFLWPLYPACDASGLDCAPKHDSRDSGVRQEMRNEPLVQDRPMVSNAVVLAENLPERSEQVRAHCLFEPHQPQKGNTVCVRRMGCRVWHELACLPAR